MSYLRGLIGKGDLWNLAMTVLERVIKENRKV
jgi:hypothetical protein